MSTWVPLPRSTEGVEVLDDGTIKLSALRAAGFTYVCSYVGIEKITHIATLVANKIRFTAAIPMDVSVKYGYKLATDRESQLPTGSTVTDLDAIAPYFSRQYGFKAGEACKRWLRKKSYVTPESVKDAAGVGAAAVDDKLGTGGFKANALRDDTEYLQHQCERRLTEVGRVAGKKSIFVQGLVLSYKPGDQIKDIDGVPFGKTVSEVKFHTGNETQVTELVCE